MWIKYTCDTSYNFISIIVATLLLAVKLAQIVRLLYLVTLVSQSFKAWIHIRSVILINVENSTSYTHLLTQMRNILGSEGCWLHILFLIGYHGCLLTRFGISHFAHCNVPSIVKRTLFNQYNNRELSLD